MEPPTLDAVNTDNDSALHENWPYEYFEPIEGDAIDNLMVSIEAALHQLDIDLEQVYDSRFVRSATTEELNYLGNAVGLERRTRETNSHFRFRVQAQYASLTSNTTFSDVALVLRAIFGESVRNAELRVADDEPHLIIMISSAMLNSTPITVETLTELLEDTTPMGHGLSIELLGSFQFSADGYTPPEGTGFGEGGLGSSLE